MKKLLSLSIVAICMFATNSFGQPIAENNSPEGFTSGQVTLRDNSTLSGAVKDNIRKKGEIIVSADGRKTRYNANDLKSVRIGNTEYITSNYGFYEVIWQGNNITLVRKANEPNGIQYVGNEPVAITNEGAVDDYFIRNGIAPLQLLTKKNNKEVIGKICANCAVTLEPARLDIEKIKKILPDCDKCQ